MRARERDAILYSKDVPFFPCEILGSNLALDHKSFAFSHILLKHFRRTICGSCSEREVKGRTAEGP